MNYRIYRERQGISRKDMIDIIGRHYPGYTKAQQSMVDNPRKYGVCLLPQAEQILREACEKNKRKAFRKKPNRLVVYLDDELNASVRDLIEKSGYDTVQSFLENVLKGLVIA